MQLNIILLAASPSTSQAIAQMFPFVLIFAVMYFLLIVPNQRQRKKTQEMLAGLKSGDKVVTTGGVYGTIAGFPRDGVVQLQIATQVKIDVARTAIAGLQPDEAEAAKAAEALKKKS